MKEATPSTNRRGLRRLGWSFLLGALASFITTGQSATLFPPGSTWKHHLGTNSPTPADPTLWRQVNFDDSAWAGGIAPIGYANPANDPGGFEATIATTLRPGSSTPTYTTVYLRKTFLVTDPSALSEFTVTASYDDGVVLWINGVEVGRDRAPAGEPGYTATSPSQAETVTAAFTVTNAASWLVPGTNVLAVLLLNGGIFSPDLFFDASIESSADTAPPVLVNRLPPPGAILRDLREIEVFFSEPVVQVDAADLLINGIAATNVIDVNGSQFLFQFPSPPTGAVEVVFANDHGITDRAPVPNPFAGASWSYRVHSNPLVEGLVINEFMARNDHGLRDEDGDRSDWIEIFNGTGSDVSLDGWYLTDTALNLTKWRVPGVGIAASGYLLIFASSKNRANPTAPLHTNFRLSGDAGSFVALVDPTGTNIVSSFVSYPAQFDDVSYGRDRNDPGIVGYYTNATPNDANSLTGAGFAPPVLFSKTGSTFVTPFHLTLSSLDTDTVIRYFLVTNAATAAATNVPNLSSPIYTAPIPIAGPTIVRARAFSTRPGVFPGVIRSETFLQVSASVLNFSSDLPLIIIHNFGAGPYPTSQAEFLSAFAVFDNSLDRASLTNTPVLTTRAGVNLRGYSTVSYPKGSFAVEFRDEFDDEAELSLLDMPEESDWVLYAPNNIEPVCFHNPLYYRMSREIGRYASRTRFAEVFLNTSTGAIDTSHYNGLYVVEEKPKRAAGRVDITRLDDADTNAPAVTGGYLLAIDWVDPGEPTFQVPGVGSVPSQTVIYHYPRGNVIQLPQRQPQEQYINHYLRSFVTNLASPGFNTSTGYVQYIDVDSWIDHFIIGVTAFNIDALRLSTYFYKDRGQRIEMGPVWDCDRCMGSTDGREFNPRVWASAGGTDFFNWPWWGRLFSDADFFQRYIDRYQEVRQVAFSETNLFALIDGFASEIAEAYPREFARWHVPPRGTNGTGAGTFATEVQWKKHWMSARLRFMDTNFLGPVAIDLAEGLVTPGSQVTLTPPNRVGGMTTGFTNATVYYTLDGTDPRAPGGAVASGARSNLGPLTIPITNNVRLVARAFNRAHRNLTGSYSPPRTSSWSGPTEATFYVTIPPLRITEIMYHPQPPASGDATDPELFEYIEVKNIGGAPLDVNRFTLRGGVEFDFPSAVLAPGESAAIVRSIASFRARYGNDVRVLGEYVRNLGNNGDRLILEGGVREPILDFDYQDAWHPITDGPGFSLQIVDENATPETWRLKESWRPGGIENGTPGVDDPGPPSHPPVVVNEALTGSQWPDLDAIELWNLAAVPANIGHWWLTDDFGNPRKYRIPPDTTLPPSGYVAFDESQFNSGLHAFALSSKGDEVYLFSGDADGRLTGYLHGFRFGAQIRGVTFGRHVISTGEDHFVRQAANTLHGANSGPLVGPVVISEINYHPPDIHYPLRDVNNSEDEYLELLNISGDTVPMYDPANPDNTWRLREAVDFRFPRETALVPNERVLVVSFTPTNGPQLAAFKSRHRIPEDIRIFGPWDGQLDNAGEGVELTQPDVPNPGVEISDVVADRVEYATGRPWAPEADGSGPSLHRRNVALYGNDPANWAAAAPSPGRPYLNSGVPVIAGQPEGRTNMVYDPIVLSVEADGTSPLRYQWRRNGSAVFGATNSSLVMPSALPAQEGVYDVVVFNASGAVVSVPVMVKVRIPMKFTSQPQSMTVQSGTNVSFSVGVVSYEPPVQYQWYFNGSRIPNATNAVYDIDRVGLENEGRYYLVGTDGVGTSNSIAADLVVVVPPVILVQPLPYLETPMGGTAVLSVTVSNTASLPLAFRWRKAGISIPGASFIQNDYTSILTLLDVTNTTPISYSVIVTNIASRFGVFSANCLVVAVGDIDRDGIPDSVEQQWGLNPNDPHDAAIDDDDDSMTNLEEYIAGTDPVDPDSSLKISAVALPPDLVQLEFAGVSNRTYTVEFADQAGSGGWTRLDTVSARITNFTGVVFDPSPGNGRWYRLVTPAYQ